MARTFIWYMLSLHRRKVVALFLLLAFANTVDAQYRGRGNTNFDDYKSKDLYFGLSLGFNSSKHQVFHSREFIGNPGVRLAQGAPSTGFEVHGIVNYKLGDFFDFRLLPGISFTTRHLDFNEEFDPLTATSITDRTTVESIFAEIPIHIRYKSAPYKDKRAFIVGGLNYTFDLASNSQTRQAEDFIRISPHEFRLEAGVGMQFFFQFFILSPELKFSQGINNTLLFNDQIIESTVLEKLLGRTVTLSFHFEG